MGTEEALVGLYVGAGLRMGERSKEVVGSWGRARTWLGIYSWTGEG